MIEFRNNIVQDTRHAGILVRSKAASSAIRVVFDGTVLINAANHAGNLLRGDGK